MNQYAFIPKWIPNKSFGPIVFGDHVTKYRKDLNLVKTIAVESKDEWETYEVSGSDVSIDTEDDIIMAVSIRDVCIYKGKNIIGMNIIDLASLLKADDYDVEEGIVYNDGDIQTPITFDDFGLQAWFSCNALVTVSIADYTED